MTYEEALAILGDAVKADGLGPTNGGGQALGYVRFYHGASVVELDNGFTADELEAITVYMRAHGPKSAV